MASKAAAVGQDHQVDNWEEIDEEQLASQLSRLTNDDDPAKPGKAPSEATGDDDEPSGSRGRSAAANSLPAMLEEELRPRMILQRPQMQILRRPQSKAQEEKAAADQKPKTQIKSLDQRKQEYAEARLRILGSAHDEEEQQQKQVEQPKKPSPNTNGHRISSNSSNNNASSSRTPQQNSFRQAAPSAAPPSAGNYQLQPQQPQNQHPYYSPHSSGGRNQPPPQPPPLAMTYQQQATPPHPGAYHFQHHQKQMSPYGMIPHHHHHQHQHQQQQQPAGFPHMGGGHGYPGGASGGANSGHSSNNNVLRLPAGPDGSHGFTIRR